MSTSTSMSSNKPLKRLSLLQSPTSFAFDTSTLPSPASPSAHTASKNARRQSSIYYLPPDNVSSNTSPVDVSEARHNRRHSTLGYSPAKARANTSASKERSKRQTTSLTETSASAALTLVEKHADLLRFIAQKESRCSELRAQLTTEEAELLTLKRKWERIVRRGFDTGSISNVNMMPLSERAQLPSLAGTGDAAALLSGLREGVQGVGRLLAQLGTPENQLAEEERLRKKDLGHASESSVSTAQTSSSASTRLSQSSMSSVEASEEEVLVSGKPSLRELSTSTPIRRRPYEPSSPHSRLPLTPLSGPTSPSVSSPRPGLKSVDNTKESTRVGLLRSSSASSTIPHSQRKRTVSPAQCANASPSPVPFSVNPPSGAFPAGVVTLPGASTSAAAAAKWVGRRISAHTSMFLSDALAALASPTTPNTGSASPGSRTPDGVNTAITTATPHRRAAPSCSLLDESEEGQEIEFGEWSMALAPEKIPVTPTTATSSSSSKPGSQVSKITNEGEADTDEWNW